MVDRIDVAGVRRETIHRNDPAQKWHFMLAKDTLPQLGPEILGMQSAQDLLQSVIMHLLCRCIDENAIDIGANPLDATQHLFCASLECCYGMCQT